MTFGPSHVATEQEIELTAKLQAHAKRGEEYLTKYQQANMPAPMPSSVASTLAERGKRYGDFSAHASYSQRLQDDMRAGLGWNRLTDVQRQALTVIADKIARILSGDPEYKDNWHDIQGYAKLAEDRCTPQ